MVQNLLGMSGSIIDSQTEVGGYPVLPPDSRPAGWDTDQDGMPDYWELAVGTNPQLANNNHTNSDGYTDLEHYLSWLADLHASGPQDAALDVDLGLFTPAMTNATYSRLQRNQRHGGSAAGRSHGPLYTGGRFLWTRQLPLWRREYRGRDDQHRSGAHHPGADLAAFCRPSQ